MTRHRYLLALLAISFILFGMSLQANPFVKEETVQGTVLRAGDAKLTLMASPDGAIQRFAVASDAIISRDGSYTKLEDVHYGDFALVSVKKSEDALIATVIVAISPLKGDGGFR